MNPIQQCKTALAVAAICVASAAFPTTMNKGDYSAAKDRIEADYKADKAACDRVSGNDKDVCQEKARGKQKVARAELEYGRTGKAADANKIAFAKADAGYAVAKEMCDDKAGTAKDLCVTEAKAAHTKALANARLTEKVGEARKSAADDKRDAYYQVAVQKCESLAGDAKSACLSSAKARFDKG